MGYKALKHVGCGILVPPIHPPQKKDLYLVAVLVYLFSLWALLGTAYIFILGLEPFERGYGYTNYPKKNSIFKMLQK